MGKQRGLFYSTLICKKWENSTCGADHSAGQMSCDFNCMKKYDNFISMLLKTPDSLKVKNKTVLVRVDYNVPLKKGQNDKIEVVNADRIIASLETIKFLQKNNAKIVLMSHLGRPKSPVDTKYSLKPVAEYIKKKLKIDITFLPDLTGNVGEDIAGSEVRQAIQDLPHGSICLLENLRFNPGEEKNSTKFSKQLADLADIYINEAFSTSHREHASVAGVSELLPSFAGFSLEKEVSTFDKMMSDPKKPLIIILGGAKISDKVEAIANLAGIADIVLVGGATANSFLKAEGLETYKSYIEEASADLKKQKINYVDVACSIIEKHKTEKMLMDGYIPLPKILYPIDVVAAESIDEKNADKTKVIELTKENGDSESKALLDKKQNGLLYLDIGPKTTQLYTEIIKHAKTIFWNGPMGVWENPVFAIGSKKVAAAVALSDAYSIIGGGDTIACVNHFGLEKQYSYVSAAGGAALDYVSGKKLPGLARLTKG
jgi:3-phosphoglycerate kinase